MNYLLLEVKIQRVSNSAYELVTYELVTYGLVTYGLVTYGLVTPDIPDIYIRRLNEQSNPASFALFAWND